MKVAQRQTCKMSSSLGLTVQQFGELKTYGWKIFGDCDSKLLIGYVKVKEDEQELLRGNWGIFVQALKFDSSAAVRWVPGVMRDLNRGLWLEHAFGTAVVRWCWGCVLGRLGIAWGWSGLGVL